MRNLADGLGFKVMALYNHVANKQQLLGLMLDVVAEEIDDPPDDMAPLAAIRSLAISMRTTLTEHPWVPDLWLQHMPGPARTANMERLLRLFDESGLSPVLAHHGFHAVTNHVIGYTIQDVGMTAMATSADPDDPMALAYEFLANTPAEVYPHTVAHLHQHLNEDVPSSYELVLDFILDGLVRLNTSTT